METKLNPPVLDSKTIAQANAASFSIPFLMNKSVGWEDFDSVSLQIKTVQSNKELVTLTCKRESLLFNKGKYWGTFINLDENKQKLFQVGQHYKAQLAYVKNNNVGFYSTVTTFKFTSNPTIKIQNLTNSGSNIHVYSYTGVYINDDDPSEKVYSYEFNLYDNFNHLVATSGEMLHNSSLDTATNSSTDTWTTRYGLNPNKTYSLVYKIKTINGLEKSSINYKIVDNQTVPSTLFKYCDFVATNLSDNACVELTLEPRHNIEKNDHKYVSGQFVLLRSSNEDNFTSWHELTRFILASHYTANTKFICRDYCVSQGVTYRYALQAYNNQGLYSTREETKDILTDFEDMFLSDGKRQLRIKFNPQVSSFKNTILESKTDTIGGKYPFFFRNGNVNYKEFPISGLISMLMDEEEEFMQGIQVTQTRRTETPAAAIEARDLKTALTGDNFRREREFKLEVLNWLTNGKPKYFRSPGEGSYIVRLMNTSLSPNDALSRMLHTFSCTAYEIADHTFENLRKYGMMMDEYLETRNLNFHTVKLHEQKLGSVANLNACMATLHAQPGTKFRFKLSSDTDAYNEIEVGMTGVYIFDKNVLAENFLMEICPPNNVEQSSDYWLPQATLIYAVYANYEVANFSHIAKIDIVDKIAQWIGRNKYEVNEQLYSMDPEKMLKNLGTVYYLNIQKRPIVTSVTVEGTGPYYTFKEGDVDYNSIGYNELIFYNNEYYDGCTKMKITDPIDFSFQLRYSEDKIDLKGINIKTEDELDSLGPIQGCDFVTDVGGRIILTNVKDVDCLYIGNGLYVDIAYQEIQKTYTPEITSGHPVQIAKQAWKESGAMADYNWYYSTLKEIVLKEEEDLVIDAI